MTKKMMMTKVRERKGKKPPDRNRREARSNRCPLKRPEGIVRSLKSFKILVGWNFIPEGRGHYREYVLPESRQMALLITTQSVSTL